MLSARLYNKQDIRIEEIPRPGVGACEMLIKVRNSFICGTDVRMYKNGHKNASTDSPLVLGHELSGVIEEVGAKVQKYKVGDRVAVAPNMGCGICDLCVSGLTHLCEEYQAFGISIDGGFAEYVKIPEAAICQGNVVSIGDHVSHQEAALAEPLSCVYSAFERAQIAPGDVVLIIGAGPIGIMHGCLAKTAGAGKIIYNDHSEERLTTCARFDGSCMTVKDNLKAEIMELTSGHGVAVCITACPSSVAQEMSLELTAVNGRVIFFGGLPPNSKPTLDTNLIHYKQLIVTGTTRASMMQFRKALRLIEEKSVDVERLISTRSPISEFSVALMRAAKGEGLKHGIFF